MSFSTGSVAKAICDRCKMKVLYTQLTMDRDKPGLRVCIDCCDVKDPWKIPRPRNKPITLRYPRPDISLTVPYGYIITDQSIGDMQDQGLYITTESGSRIKIG